MPKGILRKWLFDKSIPIPKTTAWRLKGSYAFDERFVLKYKF